VTPVRLDEDGVNLLKVDGFGAISDGFDHGADAEVFDGSEGAFGTAGDEVGGGFGEGAVRETNTFELVVDVGGEVCGGELFEFCGVGDPRFYVLVGTELEGGVEGWLPDEDEVMVFGEVFEEEAEFAEGFDRDEVGVVDDGDENFPSGVEVSCFFDESGFAFVVVAVAVEVEGLAEETEDVVPGVVIFEDGFSGAGFSDDEAEAALLGVDF